MSEHQKTSNAPLSAEVESELSQIIRYGDENSSLIWVEPICKFFGIGYDWHRKLIKNDPILQSVQRKNTDYFAFGDKRQRVLLPKKGFLRWIQIINPNTVRPELREKFILFQTVVFDFVYGTVENSEKEKELYASIKRKRELKKQLTDEIRRETLQLNQIYAIKYGQLQLDIVDRPQ